MIKNDSKTSKIPIKAIFNYSWFYRLHMVHRFHMCARIGAASLATLARLGGD